MQENGRVIRDGRGMGGFLDPPTYPTHAYFVETDLRRRKENRGAMSLDAAKNAEWLDAGTRAHAARLLESWTPPAFDSPEVQEWKSQVLGYFANCYVLRSGNRDVDKLVISGDPERFSTGARSPIFGLMHRGVDFVQSFYPDFTPTALDFDSARWGK